jgi:hypothetical protein
MTEAPVMVARPSLARDTTSREVMTRQQPTRDSWTPTSSPAVAVAIEAAGDLWADDPFAAPKRRAEALAPVTGIEESAVAVAAPDAAPVAEAPTPPVLTVEEDRVRPTIETPVKKRRTPAKKSASA